jgi:FkbM family methyltransferase
MTDIDDVSVPRKRGYSDFEWLKQQALDKQTLRSIALIETDEKKYLNEGIVTVGDDPMVLNMRQGTFHTTRATGHSLANVFVQIFKCQEHAQARDFRTRNGDVVVDLGANEGYYAMNMANGVDARIIAVEPNPIAHRLLVQNIKKNKLSSIEAVNCAVWSSTGEMKMNVLPQVTSIGALTLEPSSYMIGAMERVVQIPVRTITLPDLMASMKIDKIDMLKMDVEGAEVEVLEGSHEVFDKIDKIVLEYHSQKLRNKVIDMLEAKGFKLVLHVPDRADFGDLYFTK